MAEARPRATRRQLLAGALAGAVAGGAWGAAIQSAAKPSEPTVSIIGRGASQVALLDSTRLRILILLGPADDDLISAIPILMTMVRQRIDILVGASETIDVLPPEFISRWQISHTLTIPIGNESRLHTRTTTSVEEGLRLDLDANIVVELRRSTRNAWSTIAPAATLWCVSARIGSNVIDFAPDMLSAETLADARSSVLAIPRCDIDRIGHLQNPGSLAINARDDDDAPSGTTLVRIFPKDVARFTIHDDHVTLPSWAVTAPESPL